MVYLVWGFWFLFLGLGFVVYDYLFPREFCFKCHGFNSYTFSMMHIKCAIYCIHIPLVHISE